MYPNLLCPNVRKIALTSNAAEIPQKLRPSFLLYIGSFYLLTISIDRLENQIKIILFQNFINSKTLLVKYGNMKLESDAKID